MAEPNHNEQPSETQGSSRTSKLLASVADHFSAVRKLVTSDIARAVREEISESIRGSEPGVTLHAALVQPFEIEGLKVAVHVAVQLVAKR